MTDEEFPIHRLMASGTCWRASSAKVGDGETWVKIVEYSLRRLSFSVRVRVNA